MINLTKTDIIIVGVKQWGKSYFVTNRLLPIYRQAGYHYVIIDTKCDRGEDLGRFCGITVNEPLGVWQAMNARWDIHFAVLGTVAEKQRKIDIVFSKVMFSSDYIFIIDETQAVKELFRDANSNILSCYTASGCKGINFVFLAQKLTAQLPTIIRENATIYVFFRNPDVVTEDYKKKFPNIQKTSKLNRYECLVTNWTGEYFIMDKDGKIIEKGGEEIDTGNKRQGTD